MIPYCKPIYIIAIIIGFATAAISQFPAVRTIDGKFNNFNHVDWGSKGDQLVRIVSVDYADSIGAVDLTQGPNPRMISNRIFAQQESISDIFGLSDFVWGFGQFLDHDITFVPEDRSEMLFIEIPEDDEHFSPGSNGLRLFRNRVMRRTGNSPDNPRQYFNEVTAFIDGSAVYGSDQSTADWLRSFEDGKLKVSQGNNLPWNTVTGEFNDPIDEDAPHMEDALGSNRKLYVAGDARANENPILVAFHTLFVREHNRLCDHLKAEHPDWTDTEIYQMARKWNSAFIQSIVYNEWLPAMGIKLNEFNGYRPDVNPQVSNVFSTAAFRIGHTLLNSNLLRYSSEDSEDMGAISLRDAFFNNTSIDLAGGIEPFLRGMAAQPQQKMDCKVVDDVRNFLFGGPNSGGLDLAAINIARGRERGVPDFNTIRRDLGLPEIKSFDNLTKHEEVAELMEEVYGSPDNIDAWVGMLAEDYMPDAIMGNTIMYVLQRQFEALRDGDRFYYEADQAFSPEEVSEISNTTLRDIIMRNTDIKLMQENVFFAKSLEELERGPELDASVPMPAAVYPNPSFGIVNLKFEMNKNTEVAIEVFDVMGRLMERRMVDATEGNNFVRLNNSNEWTPGMYNIRIAENNLNFRILRVFIN